MLIILIMLANQPVNLAYELLEQADSFRDANGQDGDGVAVTIAFGLFLHQSLDFFLAHFPPNQPLECFLAHARLLAQ